MNVLSKVAFIVGVICLLYYGVIVYYAGIQSSFAWLWLLAGVGSIVGAMVLRYLWRQEIEISRPLMTMMIGAFIIAFSIFVFIEGMIVYHANKEAKPGMDYIIVLGAQVRGTRITRSLKERLEEAILYLNENPGTLAIVSGGQGPGEDITEARAMNNYLIKKGIDEKRIILEERSRNTNENILYSKKLITMANPEVAVVTNGFHVFRAKRIALKQGFPQVQGIAADSDPILFINYYVREFFGVLKDWTFGNLDIFNF